MSREGNMRIILLFEDELRLAAKALRTLDDEVKATEGKPSMETVNGAIQACGVALFHLMQDGAEDAQVTIAAKSMFNLKAVK
jgi:hypothetical protein